MFSRTMFGQMRRAGLGVGVSKRKLSQAMVEILVQVPVGTKSLKEVVVANLGMVGMMSATRDINDAWNEAKKKAARDHPDKFILDGRSALHWNDGSISVLDKKISAANFKKLNEISEAEDCSVNQLVSKLIRKHRADAKKKNGKKA